MLGGVEQHDVYRNDFYTGSFTRTAERLITVLLVLKRLFETIRLNYKHYRLQTIFVEIIVKVGELWLLHFYGVSIPCPENKNDVGAVSQEIGIRQ